MIYLFKWDNSNDSNKTFELDKPGWIAAFVDAHKRKENKHCSVLWYTGLSNAKLAFFRGKICPPQTRNCQNRNSHTSKIVCLLPVCLINDRHLANQDVRKVLWKMLQNCVRNRSRPDEIDTETEICTSLKSEFYFRFRWPPSTKSTLISYISFGDFVTIRGKLCPSQSQNCQVRTLHISLDNRSVDRHTDRQKPKWLDSLSKLHLTDKKKSKPNMQKCKKCLHVSAYLHVSTAGA